MPDKAENTFTDLKFRVRDGLSLHARHYPAASQSLPRRRRPLVCLPGLTRNGRDFHDLAVTLSGDAPHARDVYTLDYRGRGHSDWDPDWKNYAVPIEALDVVDFLTFADLHDVAVIGTSRGGLISMILAAIAPTVMKSVILNDIGPVIETDGLMRIASYVGRIPLPRSWPEAAEAARDVNKRRFTAVSNETWEEVARQWFNEKDGRPSPGYDPALKNSLSVLDGPMPALWPQFASLSRIPMLVLRGENSDILSVGTVEEMRRRHPDVQDHTVPGEGHAPLMKDRPTQDLIAAFLARTDNAEQGPHEWAANSGPTSATTTANANDAQSRSLAARITA